MPERGIYFNSTYNAFARRNPNPEFMIPENPKPEATNSDAQSGLSSASLFGDFAEIEKRLELENAEDRRMVHFLERKIKAYHKLRCLIEYRLGMKPDYEI